MSKLKSYTSFKRTIRQFDPTLQRTTDVPILDSDGSGSIDSVYDPLSYVKNVTGTVLGIYPSYLPYNQERWRGANAMNAYQIEELFHKKIFKMQHVQAVQFNFL